MTSVNAGHLVNVAHSKPSGRSHTLASPTQSTISTEHKCCDSPSCRATEDTACSLRSVQTQANLLNFPTPCMPSKSPSPHCSAAWGSGAVSCSRQNAGHLRNPRASTCHLRAYTHASCSPHEQAMHRRTLQKYNLKVFSCPLVCTNTFVQCMARKRTLSSFYVTSLACLPSTEADARVVARVRDADAIATTRSASSAAVCAHCSVACATHAASHAF
jgi:hypothetical protein